MRIVFSQEWDKLKKLRPKKLITTFRRYTPQKYKFYLNHFLKGTVFDIVLRDKKIATAQICGIQIVESDRLDNNFIKQDTYKTWTKKHFKQFLKQLYNIEKTKGIILVLKINEAIL